VERSCRNRSHMCFFNTARLEGHQISYMVGMIVYGGRHGTQGTVPARRGDIGEDAGDNMSPAQGKFSHLMHNYATV